MMGIPIFPNNGIATLNYPGVRGISDSGSLSGPTFNFPNTPNDSGFNGFPGGSPGTWGAPTGGGGEPASISLNGVLANALTTAGTVFVPCSLGTSQRCLQDIFVGNVNNASVFDATAYARSGGRAAARGKMVYESTLPGLQGTPGLSVGAFANGNSSSDAASAAAHGVAFRTYHYTGTVPTTVVLNATVSGNFIILDPELPVGVMRLFTEISVVKNATFASLLPNDPALLENFFFGIPYKHTDAVNDFDFFNLRPAQQFASGKLAGDTFRFGTEGNYQPSKSFSIPIPLNPDQSFTVLFHIATQSTLGQFVIFFGAGTVDFFGSLSSAPQMFTDESGNPVNLIEAVGGALTVPGPLTLQGEVTSLKQLIASVPNSSLFAPNPKTAENRRKAMLDMLDEVDRLIGANKYQDAIGQLRAILAKTDGILFPPDFIKPDESNLVKKLVTDLIADLVLALPK